MWIFLNTLPDGTQRFVILAKKAFTLKSHRHSLGRAAKQAAQAEVKQRWLPINLVGNFQQTQLKRPEIHKISILSHRYIHILRRALTAQGQLHLLFVLHFCCCFVVVFFSAMKLHRHRQHRQRHPHRSELNRTEPCGRVEAPETRHQGLIVATSLSAPLPRQQPTRCTPTPRRAQA